MLISISSEVVEGPWGGGNNFVKNLKTFLLGTGNQVIHSLDSPNIDIILIIDPRRAAKNRVYGLREIAAYRQSRPKTLIFHRINECDERKNTKLTNFQMRATNSLADITVLVGRWMQRLALFASEEKRKNAAVILNGADRKIFKPLSGQASYGQKKIKLVTHHWSSHPNKGMEAYKFIDGLLEKPYWSHRFEMTYIGRVPHSSFFKNIKVVPPLFGDSLALNIASGDLYITGSVNEPGGNHQVEALSCGLPIIYHDSGCMPEYCKDYGVSFRNVSEIPEVLEYCAGSYPELKKKIQNYSYDSERMGKLYLDLFNKAISSREEIIASRRKPCLKYWIAHQFFL